MRVIKVGKKLPEKIIVCKHCESELAYDNRDIKTYYAEWYHEHYIICPVCGNQIVLEHISEGC